MKQLLVLTSAIVIVLAGIFSCATENELSIENKIQGKWKLIKTVGGLTGKQIVLPSTKTIINFKTNNTFTETSNGQIIHEGTYTITSVKSIFTGRDEKAIQYSFASVENPHLVSFNVDTLILTDNNVEPFGWYYVRTDEY